MFKPLFVVVLLSAVTAFAAPVEPIVLQFNVSGPRDALLSGALAVVPEQPARIEREAARGPERQALSFDVRPMEDGRLLVRAQWQDVGSDGATVKWEPSFILKRASSAEVRLDFPGGSRTLRLTAN